MVLFYAQFNDITAPRVYKYRADMYELMIPCKSQSTINLEELWFPNLCQSLIAPSDMLLHIFGTSFLHHSEFLRSKLFIPLSATFIWTCRFNLLHTAITFHHFFTVSLWAQNFPIQKIFYTICSTIGCKKLYRCQTDLMDSRPGSRPTLLVGFYVLVQILSLTLIQN